MTCAIICSSKTGNTAKLAQRARDVLGDAVVDSVAGADTVLLGSWTDKGGLDPALSGSLAALEGKRVFLFGTCGFGGSRAYYDRVLDRFQSALPEGAEGDRALHVPGPDAARGARARTSGWRSRTRRSSPP